MSTVAQPTNSDPSTEQPQSIAAIKRRRRFRPKAKSTPQEPDAQFKPSTRKPRARGRTATSIPPAAGVAPGNVPIPAPSLTNSGGPGVRPNRKADRGSNPLRGKGRIDVTGNPSTSNTESAPISQPLPLTGPSGPISVHQGPSEKKSTEGKGKGAARGLAVKENKAPAQLLTQEEKDALKAAKREQKRLQNAKKKEDHYRLVLSAAEATIAVLNKHGIPCATFGSLACKLYGTFRDPKDVDLLVLEPPNPDTPPRTAEEIKTLIIDTDPRHFFLKMPRDPEAPYRILYYRQEYLEAQCKVDILIPGTMYLPNLSQPSHSVLPRTVDVANTGTVPPMPPLSSSAIPVATDTIPPPPRNHITTVSGIPLVPFSLLLLHKLQGWDDHRVAPEPHKQRKQAQDAADVRRLMAMEERMKELQLSQPWADPGLFCEEFQQLTKERVKEYCLEFPNRAVGWQTLGFETA